MVKENPNEVVLSPAELELKELIKDNIICGNLVAFSGLAVFWVTYLIWGIVVAHAILLPLIGVIYFGSAVGYSWENHIEMGKGDDVCRMLAYNKVAAYFLMLYCHHPSRTIRVLQLVKQQQQQQEEAIP